MAADTEWWLLLPRPVRSLPADLAAVLAVTAAAVLAVLVPGVSDTPLRVVFGLPLVLFLPGYALVAALFPERGPDPEPGEEAGDGSGATAVARRESGIDGVERVALSFGLSIAVVPLLGLALNFTPWGIREFPVLVTVAGFTGLASAVAASRRRALPADERFRVPYREWTAAARAELFDPASRADAALNVVLVASVLLAAASVTYAVAVPQQGEQFTEFYVLTENETGALVADGYPTEFERGEARPVVLGVGNHEGRPMEYTAVAVLERVRVAGNETTVLDRRELDRLPVRVAANGTWQRSYEVRPTMTGQRLRLAFLLYRGDAPAEPRVDGAYRELHLWVNVTAPGQSRLEAPQAGS